MKQSHALRPASSLRSCRGPSSLETTLRGDLKIVGVLTTCATLELSWRRMKLYSEGNLRNVNRVVFEKNVMMEIRGLYVQHVAHLTAIILNFVSMYVFLLKNNILCPINRLIKKNSAAFQSISEVLLTRKIHHYLNMYNILAVEFRDWLLERLGNYYFCRSVEFQSLLYKSTVSITTTDSSSLIKKTIFVKYFVNKYIIATSEYFQNYA